MTISNMAEQRCVPLGNTPTGFNIVAQGQRRSRATLGREANRLRKPQRGFTKEIGVFVQPRWGWRDISGISVLGCAYATLGCVVKLLRS